MSEFGKKEIDIFISSITEASESKSFLYKNLVPLILSKRVFKNSNELKEFIKSVINLELHDYVYKSRTILIGKIVRYINSLGLDDIINLSQSVEMFLLDLVKVSQDDSSEQAKSKKKSSAFSRWNEYISKQSF